MDLEKEFNHFLIHVRNGHFEEAFRKVTDPEFQSKHISQLGNMNILEEFFKKNNFEIPNKLIEYFAPGK